MVSLRQEGASGPHGSRHTKPWRGGTGRREGRVAGGADYVIRRRRRRWRQLPGRLAGAHVVVVVALRGLVPGRAPVRRQLRRRALPRQLSGNRRRELGSDCCVSIACRCGSGLRRGDVASGYNFEQFGERERSPGTYPCDRSPRRLDHLPDSSPSHQMIAEWVQEGNVTVVILITSVHRNGFAENGFTLFFKQRCGKRLWSLLVG